MSLISLFLTGLAVVGVLTAEDCTKSTCNDRLINYYTELNCKPVLEDGACCPSSFDCSAFNNRSPKECHMKEKSYSIGTKMEGAESGNPCIAECKCVNLYGQFRPGFYCVFAECFEEPRLGPDCLKLYEPGKCCSKGDYCKNDTNSAAKEVFKCQYGDESYVLGQKFYPKEKPCLSCLCQKGFDGTLNGPWCKEATCLNMIHYGTLVNQGCAPISIKGRCCPHAWRCPSHKDKIAKRVPAVKKGAPQCTFGSLKLNVSETLHSTKKCIVCTCEIPPHVSCIQTANSC